VSSQIYKIYPSEKKKLSVHARTIILLLLLLLSLLPNSTQGDLWCVYVISSNNEFRRSRVTVTIFFFRNLSDYLKNIQACTSRNGICRSGNLHSGYRGRHVIRLMIPNLMIPYNISSFRLCRRPLRTYDES